MRASIRPEGALIVPYTTRVLGFGYNIPPHIIYPTLIVRAPAYVLLAINLLV